MSSSPILDFSTSRAAIARASAHLPGGVSSNFRLGVSPTPLVLTKAHDCYVYDADGNQLIDYYCAMGPIILGHDPSAVIAAAKAQLNHGILFGGQTEIEFEAARLVCEMVPCADMVRFGSSGSEVVQAAIRLARAATGRQTIVKFEGHYHGWLDNVQWSTAPSADDCGPSDRPHKVPGTPGQDLLVGDTIAVLGWNDAEAVRARLEQGDVAAVIMEPAMCNSSAVPPLPGYLERVRELCSSAGTILIFDEVITGFRLSPGGAQQLFGITPDLATFGKAIANGFPVAAVAGRRNLMERFATERVMHGGTYNAHPVAMAAMVAVLNEMRGGAVHREIGINGAALMAGIDTILRDRGIPARVQGFPGIFYVALGVDTAMFSYRDMLQADRKRYVRFTTALLEHGVRALERGAWFVSQAHDADVVARTLEAVDEAAQAIA